MKKRFPALAFAAIFCVLAGCATPPKTPPALDAQVTVEQFADLDFKPLEIAKPVEVALTKGAPVTIFKEGKGYAAPFQLPDADGKRYLRFEARTGGGPFIPSMNVMVPKFAFLDAQKAFIEDVSADTFISNASFARGHWYSSMVVVPNAAKYVVARPSRWTKQPLVIYDGNGQPVELPLANSGTTKINLTTETWALLGDSGRMESGTKAQLFVVDSIDGQKVDNAIGETSKRSAGRGFQVNLALHNREVPVKKMRLTLLGTHRAGAPIHQIFGQMSGSFLSVRGDVDFDPAPEGRYVVKGKLLPGDSSVWVEDATSGERVTEMVTGK